MTMILTCEAENLTVTGGVPSCTEWQILEYHDASNMVAAMDYYLGFDLPVFLALNSLFLVAFVTALAAGKVARTLGRT